LASIIPLLGHFVLLVPYFHGTITPLRMPKKKKKGKQQTADDDFDDMLAEVMAADLPSPSTSSNSSSAISATTSTPSRIKYASMPSEETIVNCCIVGNVLVPRLMQWAQQGVRVVSAEPLMHAAGYGWREMVRVLIKELGANVNQARDNGCTPLYIAAQEGHEAVVMCLVQEFGADVNQAIDNGCTPLCVVAKQGHIAVVRCFLEECGANINQATNDGYTPLYMAAQDGMLAVVRCLVTEYGADFNQACRSDRSTPLMIASANKQSEVVVWLIKHGANAQASTPAFGMAADVSSNIGAPAEQTAYLEARTHCANPGCDGAGLKKCAGCLKVFFCGPACIRAHWPARKAECKRWGTERKAGL
jgi:hypothetical protein